MEITLEKIELVKDRTGVSYKEAKEALENVGLGNKFKNLPNQLSGGQQQRASIARALVGTPSLILADEPTGALDSKTGVEVMALFQNLHKAGHTIVLITHNNAIASAAQRIIRLEDGRVVYDGSSAEDTSNHDVFLSERRTADESAGVL